MRENPHARRGPLQAWIRFLRSGLSRDAFEDELIDDAQRSRTRENLQRLRPFVVGQLRTALAGCGLAIIGTLAVLPQPLITRYIIDDVLLARDLGLFAGALLLLVGVKTVALLSEQLQYFFFTRFEQRVLLDLQQSLLSRALRLPKAFFDGKETGYLMSRLAGDVHEVRLLFSNLVVSIGTNALRLVGGVAFLFYLEWRLALVSVVVLPALVFVVRFFSRKLRNLSHHGMERQGKVWTRLRESLSSTGVIKAFASEEREVARVMAEQRSAFRIALESVTVGSLASLAIAGTADVVKLLVLAAGGIMVINEQWSLGSLLAFHLYLGYVFSPAQFLASSNLRLQTAFAALERVAALFSIVPEYRDGFGVQVERLEGEIEFRDVSFSYDGREPVLREVSCRICPGEHVALIGASGAGKSTFMSLVLRFYVPTSGEVYYDGVAGADFDLGRLRQRIGFVSQRTELLAGTVADNLRYGDAEASAEAVARAARTAGLHELIVGLPGGYETHLGEGGVNLSEGQRQRLAIARALVKDPDVLVLDEPTSSLDADAEASVLRMLPDELRAKTVLVVTHSEATVRMADRVLVLEDGKLRESTESGIF